MKATPITLIRSHHRQALWMPAIWTAIVGLALLTILDHWWHPQDTDKHIVLLCECWALIGLGATLARVRSRYSRQTVACTLDERLMSHNRVEAAAELANRTDALAEAQRRDTEAFLSKHRPPPAWLWPTGMTLLVLLVALQLYLFGLLGYGLASSHFARYAARAAQADAAKIAEANAEAKANADAKDEVAAAKAKLPTATLNWVSPSPESSAAPIEEVPLTAEADSTTGLKSVALVVTVNGEARPEIKLPKDLAAGHQTVELSLYLDELNVQSFDMVTYFLRAQPVAPAGVADAAVPAITSPLQFLQVRSLWDDTKLANNKPAAPPPKDDPSNPITTLKLAEVKLMRDTFGLAKDPDTRAGPDWASLNKMAGSAQSALADRTDEAIKTAQEAGVPGDIIDLLTQAKGRMVEAVNSLNKPDPDAAGTDQGRALAKLTAVEKYYTKVISQAECDKPPVPDPFKVNQPFKLPPREPTAAGQLEQLARIQSDLADKVASAASSSSQSRSQSSASSSPIAGVKQIATTPSPSSSPSPGSGAKPGAGSSPSSGSNAGMAAAADLHGQQPSATNKPGMASSPSGAPSKPSVSPNLAAAPGSSAPPASSPGPGASSSPGSETGLPTVADLTAQQRKVANDIKQLAAAGALPKEAMAAVNAAADASLESAGKLSADDPGAAAEPAARAAAELRDAVSKMDAAGRADAAALLATAQRTLNQSAGDLAGAKPEASKSAASDAAASTAQVENALRDGATKQQEQGSIQGAQQLADLANAIAASQVQTDLKVLASAGAVAPAKARQDAANKLTALAQGAANGQTAIGNQEVLAAQALEALRRDRLNLDRADRAGASTLRGLHEDVLAQAQIALSAAMGNRNISTSVAQGDAKRVNDAPTGPIAMLAPPPPPVDDPQHGPFMRMMGTQIDALISMIVAPDVSTRPQVLATGQVSDAPPAYRPSVANYFESLAHDPAPSTAHP